MGVIDYFHQMQSAVTFRPLVSLLLLLFCIQGFSQSAQSEYLEAKRLLQNERYVEAESAFAGLVTNKTFGKYAGFYRAYCLYKTGSKKQAIVQWESLLNSSLEPKFKSETIFWLAYSCLESGLYVKGIKYASDLTNETYNNQDEEDLLNKFLANLTPEQVKSSLFE